VCFKNGINLYASLYLAIWSQRGSGKEERGERPNERNVIVSQE
jgi:hypothetical protein